MARENTPNFWSFLTPLVPAFSLAVIAGLVTNYLTVLAVVAVVFGMTGMAVKIAGHQIQSLSSSRKDSAEQDRKS